MTPTDKIKELVQKVGAEAEGIISNGLTLKSAGKNMYHCPNIHNHRNGDKNASMSWIPKKFFFHCHTCKENIDIYSYYKNYLNYSYADIMQNNGIESLQEDRKGFLERSKNRTSVTKPQVEYLETRGLNQVTIKAFKVVSCDGEIGFPYFRNGQLVGIKKRFINPTKAKMASVFGSKFYLFNSDNVNYDNTLYICEGEIDCMTVWQSGFHNVVSVGTGANSLENLFEQSEDFLNKFSEIVMLSDNDENGNNMDRAFIDRFKEKIAVVDKSLFSDLSDMNEVYCKLGYRHVQRIIESGKRKFDGEIDLDSDPYEHLSTKGLKFIPTGIDSLDYAINDLNTGSVVLITGRSNSGKSTFVNQVIGNAINHSFKTYFVLGEGDKNKIVNKFYTSVIGEELGCTKTVKLNKRFIKEPTDDALTALQKWHKGKLKLFVKALSKYRSTEELFDMLNYKAKTEGYDLFVIDNLMSLLSIEDSKSKNDLQAKFVEDCHNLAQAYNCVVILVLHPNKTYRKGEKMDFEQISGSSDIPNKADVIINVIRSDVDSDDFQNGIHGKLQLSKNRDFSDLPIVDCTFDTMTNSYFEVDEAGMVIANRVSRWKEFL